MSSSTMGVCVFLRNASRRSATSGCIKSSSRLSAPGSPVTALDSADAIHRAMSCRAGKGRFYHRRRLAGIKIMDGSVGIEHRNAFGGEQFGGLAFAHADRAGEADDKRLSHGLSALSPAYRGVLVSPQASCGPFRRKKPRKDGTAWCISMPRPSIALWPRAARVFQQPGLQRIIDDIADGSVFR